MIEPQPSLSPSTASWNDPRCTVVRHRAPVGSGSRRVALGVFASAGFLLLSGRSARSAVQPDAAGNLVLATGNEIVATINAVDLPDGQRRRAMGAILRRSVDIPGVGQFVLGRQWGLSTAVEQQEFLRLFEDMIIHTLSMRFSSYAGLRFSLGRSQQLSEDEVLINTVVEYGGSTRFSLDWRVSEVAGMLRVVDVIAEGTSLRLALRSEYAAVLTRNGGRMSALLDAMRRQVAALAARG